MTQRPDAPDDVSVDVTSRITAESAAAISRLVAAATGADGVSPLSEHATLHLRRAGEAGPCPDEPDHVRHLLLRRHGAVIGYAQLELGDPGEGATAELVVDPEQRRRGLGRRLATAARDAVSDKRIRLWAHGDQPAARALAADLGFREVRRLEQWRRSLLAPLPPVRLPAGVRVRSFRPGTADEEQWLEVNRAAFHDHPEQGAWTAADLQARLASSWFDPDGFLLAHDENAGGQLVAFHWTKIHGRPGGPVEDGAAEHAHDPLGEVYVVGVNPAHQGRGLGRALTVAGLEHLRDAGLTQAMLYVDGDNTAARATYAGLGFAPWDTDVMFYSED